MHSSLLHYPSIPGSFSARPLIRIISPPFLHNQIPSLLFQLLFPLLLIILLYLLSCRPFSLTIIWIFIFAHKNLFIYFSAFSVFLVPLLLFPTQRLTLASKKWTYTHSLHPDQEFSLQAATILTIFKVFEILHGCKTVFPTKPRKQSLRPSDFPLSRRPKRTTGRPSTKLN